MTNYNPCEITHNGTEMSHNFSCMIPKHNPDLVITKSYEKTLTVVDELQKMNFPVLLVGHCGVGKNQSIAEMAYRLNKELLVISCSGDMRASSLLGRININPKTGNPEWQDGMLTKCIRYGKWVCLDEMNSLDADILFAIHGLLDSGYIAIANNSEVVKAHPDFRLFATMNPNSYFGVKTLNQALIDRFAVYEVQPDKAIDEAIIARLSAPKEVKTSMLNLVNATREAYVKEQMPSQFFGHRALSNVVKLAQVFGLLDALDMGYINKLPIEEQSSVRGMFKDLTTIVKSMQSKHQTVVGRAGKKTGDLAKDVSDILEDAEDADA